MMVAALAQDGSRLPQVSECSPRTLPTPLFPAAQGAAPVRLVPQEAAPVSLAPQPMPRCGSALEALCSVVGSASDPEVSCLRELIASLAHELKNPLSVVAGQALMLQEAACDAVTAERARKIRRAADRSARIIDSILAMARKDPVDDLRVNLNQVIRDVLESRASQLLASGIRVTLCLEENLPAVRGDADQLHQVITNLLVNAQQAMEEVKACGRLTITSRFNAQEGTVGVKVEDNGPGIPPAIAARIFEPFVTSKACGVGTGIGLALCKRIVEAHQGSLKVGKGLGSGAVFIVRLPARSARVRIV